MVKKKKEEKDVFIYWLAVVLSIIGIVAVVVMALRVLGVI